MKCPNCGSEVQDTAKFCKKCGADLQSSSDIVKTDNTDNKNQKILIAALAVVVIILAAILLYASGVFNSEIAMETQEFDQFEIDVPVGSDFVSTKKKTDDANDIMLKYKNKGQYSDEAAEMVVGNNLDTGLISDDAQLSDTEGNAKIYKSSKGYELFADHGDSQLYLQGSDLDTLKRMDASFDEDDLTKLAKTTTSTVASQPSSPSTPSSISILGGSFYTGSAEADKTYARINVGTAHAGQNVIVQIFYSRDGNALNHGNMVPATVHSDGYLEIASADAYHYYPDFAKINIYDSNSKLLTTKSVSLSPQSGTQTF